MKKRCLLFLCNVLCVVAFCQDCGYVIGSTSPSFETPLFTLADEQPGVFLELKGITNAKFIILGIKTNLEKLCPEKGDSIVFEFSSGSKIYSKNDYSNCDRRYALYFNSLSGTALFDSLGSKAIKSIELYRKGKVAHGFLISDQAVAFRDSWKCLVDCLRSDSVANAVKNPERILRSRIAA
jgi:hypothetical protein